MSKHMTQSTVSNDSVPISSSERLIDSLLESPEECPMIYDISQNRKTSLPFIEVHTSHSNNPLRLLVDTGSSICLIFDVCLRGPIHHANCKQSRIIFRSVIRCKIY
ncbi:hypothetical protein HW555_009486 [Spodoptera exigua]|uniref:Uncharacterized protein n=1 Tax=Spodoptera exigua TaxID=7107 RepID=A0A835GCC2_SPOEX|nr:hypothetical protein HW555_009486 [Spodoptera exigua]